MEAQRNVSSLTNWAHITHDTRHTHTHRRTAYQHGARSRIRFPAGSLALIRGALRDHLWWPLPFLFVEDVCFSGILHLESRRRQWQATPVLLPRKSHGWRSLVGCSPWGRYESDTTEQLHFHFSLSRNGEGNGNPLQCSCLENPRDREAW